METTKEIEVEGKKIVLFDAKFPNATGKELEAMVKTCTDLAETGDFTIIQVEIIESDYDDYSSALADLVRVSKGKKLAKQSEDERSQNKRPRIRSEVVANAIKQAQLSSKSETPKSKVHQKQQEEVAKFTAFVNTLPIPPSKPLKGKSLSGKKFLTPSPSQTEAKGSSVKKSLTSPSNLSEVKDTSATEHPTSSAKVAATKDSPGTSIHKSSKNESAVSNSKSLKRAKEDRGQNLNCPHHKKYHKCSSQGEITNESLAAGLCQISCTQYEHRAEIKTILKNMRSEQNSSSSSAATKEKLPNQLMLHDVDFSVMEPLPMRSITAVKRMEEKLENPNFYVNLVSALSYNVSKKKHDTNTARNVLHTLVHDKITKKFTWAGQSKQGQEHKYPFGAMKLKSVVLDATMLLQKKVIKDSDISVSINQWFSQRTQAHKASAAPKPVQMKLLLQSESESESDEELPPPTSDDNERIEIMDSDEQDEDAEGEDRSNEDRDDDITDVNC
ncbi:uncharacterized protein [Bemisia tabaci]